MLTFDGTALIAANSSLFRRWILVEGMLCADELSDRSSGRQWLKPSPISSLVPPGGATIGPWQTTFVPTADLPWEEAAERASLTVIAADGRGWRLHLTVPLDGPGVTCRLELVGELGRSEHPDQDLCERWTLATRHLDLLAVELLDQSDERGTPVNERRFRLYPNERISVTAGIVGIEDPASGAGLVLVRHAPPAHARPWAPGPDVLASGGELRLRGHGCAETGQGYAWTVLVHGPGERTSALHRLARNRRRRIAGREGRLITNTWGDRNRDGRICESFLIGEAAAAAALGADAMQIDDGWQRGVSANSVAAHGGGVWDGFWAADPAFWTPHSQRLPRGLGPIAEAAREHGLDLGLWFAPDSARDFANWERDAGVHAELRQRHGIAHWKFDAVKLRSRTGELHLQRLLEQVWRQSDGQAWVDLDITAEHRPGFLGADPLGSLFVANRYSDALSWWPHETLRTLWELAWWVPPQRLRIEFLNPERNRARYGDDPLAPARYAADWPFATTLVANPLGWFEASGLSPAFAAAVSALARTWKTERHELHRGIILPVGLRPSGASTSGFLSQTTQSAQLLIFREPLAAAGVSDIVLPATAPRGPWRLIAGSGSAEGISAGVRISGLASPGWGWWRAQ